MNENGYIPPEIIPKEAHRNTLKLTYSFGRELFPDGPIGQKLLEDPPEYEIALIEGRKRNSSSQRTLITFAGAGGSVRSQIEIARKTTDAANADPEFEGENVNSIMIDSSFNPHARGMVTGSHLDRAIAQAADLYQALQQLPNTRNDITLCFRSASAMEAPYIIPILNKLLAEGGNCQIQGVIFMQAGAIFDQDLKEFGRATLRMISNEGVISQTFPSLEDYLRILRDIDNANEKNDVVLKLYKEKVLESMNGSSYCPTIFLALVEEEIERTKYAMEHPDQRLDKRIQKEDLEAKLRKLESRKTELIERIEQIPESEISKAMISELLNIDRTIVKAYPLSASPEKTQEVNRAYKRRKKLLIPTIKAMMKGEETRDGSMINFSKRLMVVLISGGDIMHAMPDHFRKQLGGLNIPVFNVFTERDPVFPANRALDRMSWSKRKSLFSGERSYMIVGEIPHSVASPAYNTMANLMKDLLIDIKHTVIEGNPLSNSAQLHRIIT